jgi:hypothetical protein
MGKELVGAGMDQTPEVTNHVMRGSDVGAHDARSGTDRENAKAQASGYGGDNPATAGTGETRVKSNTTENAEGQLNPAAPGNTGTTPGSNSKVG